MLYCLSTTDAPWSVISCPTSAVSIVLGRRAPADVVLDDATVPMLLSRRHCRLQLLPEGQLEVEDLGSLNGTFVEGPLTDGQQPRVQQLQPNTPHILQAGDTLLLGGRDTVMGLNKQMISNPFKFLVSPACADAVAAGDAGHGAVAGAAGTSTAAVATNQAATGRQPANAAGQHHQRVHQVYPQQQQQQQQEQQEAHIPCALSALQLLAVTEGSALHSPQHDRPTSTYPNMLVQRGILQASTISNAQQQHSSQHTVQQSAAAGIPHQRLHNSVSGVAEPPAKRHRGASMPPVSKADNWQLQRSATAADAPLSQPPPARHSTAVAAQAAAAAAATAADAGASESADALQHAAGAAAVAGAWAAAVDSVEKARTRSAICTQADEPAAPAAAAANALGSAGFTAQVHHTAAGTADGVERRRTTPQRAAAAAAARRAAAAQPAPIAVDDPASTPLASAAAALKKAATADGAAAQALPPPDSAAAVAGAVTDQAGTTTELAAAAAEPATAADATPGVTPASARLRRRTRPPSSGSKDMRRVRASNLECTICRELLVATHTLTCGHLFCGPCLAQWLELKAKPSCPTCRTAVESVPLRVYAIDAVVNEAVLSSGSEPQEMASRLEAWDAIKADTTARWHDMFSSSGSSSRAKKPKRSAATAAAATGSEGGRRAGVGGRSRVSEQPRQQQVVPQQPVQLQEGDRHLLSGLRHPAAAARAHDPVRGVPAATAAAAMGALAAAGTAAAPQVRRRQQGSRRGGRGGRITRQQPRQPARQQQAAAATVATSAGRAAGAFGGSAGGQQRLIHAAAGSSLPSRHSSNSARPLRQVAIDAIFR